MKFEFISSKDLEVIGILEFLFGPSSTYLKVIVAGSKTTRVLQPASQSPEVLLGPSLQGEPPMLTTDFSLRRGCKEIGGIAVPATDADPEDRNPHKCKTKS